MSEYQRQEIVETDNVYVTNMRAVIRRVMQGKIEPRSVMHIQRKLEASALRRHQYQNRRPYAS